LNQTVLADGVNRPRGWLGRGMSDNVFVTSAQLPDKLTGALSKENMTMAYNRESACQYAWKHWNTVCDDGCVAMNNGQKSSLLKLPAGSDITQLPLNNQDDCTHFVSCCIGKGGGLLLGLWDMFPAYGVLSPDRLLKRLTTEMQVARVVGQNLAAGDATEKLYKGALQRGDVILYNIPQPSDRPRIGIYSHAALHLGYGKIACHTQCRCGVDFDGVRFTTVTLLHIA